MRTRVTPFAILLAAAFGVVLTGCASGPPDEITHRAPLASCGEESYQPGSEPRDLFPQSAIDCLTDGRLDSGGEFKLTLYTTPAGDPIDFYLRAHPGTSEVELLTDISKDGTWRRPGWRRTACWIPELSSDLLNDCRSDFQK